MKRVTASDARRNWFRLLDEVASGEVVAIERGGRTLLLQRAPLAKRERGVPNYGEVIRVPSPEDASRWSWDWPGPEGDLEPTEGGGA
jgi:antitoxin (DNA-binding transcriptional repressor) of toxin-antitoxin stability system